MTKCKCGHSGPYHYYRASDRKSPCHQAEFGYDSEGYPMGRSCPCDNYRPIGGPTPATVPTTPTQGRHAQPRFHPGHRIEEYVKVYLVLSSDGRRWEIDPINFDGFSLDGLTEGPTPKESDCECDKPEQCWEAHNYAAHIELPTGQELLELIKEARSVTNG